MLRINNILICFTAYRCRHAPKSFLIPETKTAVGLQKEDSDRISFKSDNEFTGKTAAIFFR